MKHYYLFFFIATLMSMACNMASAHNIAVANIDGKTIYYNYNSDGSSVSVTYQGTSYSSYSNEYTGDVVIPETVTYNGKTYSVTSIGGLAFYGCSGLTEIKVADGNNVYDSRNNCNAIIKTSSNTLITGCKNTIIPNSVTSIGGDAFEGCSGLTSVTIPNSVTSISSSAFSGCSGLTEIIVADGNNVYDSRNNCNAIIETSINTLIVGCKNTIIPNSVTSIGSSAFWNCSGLTSVTIPNSVTNIGSGAFYGCSGLSSVTIPNSVTNIGFGAFDGTAWYDNQPDGLVYAGNVAYKYKGTMPTNTSITLKEETVGIADEAFIGCTGLTSVTTQNSVASIGKDAFRGCSGLTSVTIGNSVTSIGNGAFSGCSGLTSITWNAKDYPAFSTYSSSPFYNIRTYIKEFIIGDEVTSIPKYLCYEMSNLKSMTIPNSVTSIGSSAFYGCSGLTSITWNAKNCSASSDYSYGIRTQITEFIIGDDVTSIPSYMCYGMSNLESLTIPNSVTSIGNYAFSGCSGLTSVTIPNSVTSIGSYAFKGCSGLTSVTIPNSVTSIGDYAFNGCSGLKKVIFPNFDIKKWCSIEFGGYYDTNPLYYAHHLYSDENTEITKLVIPDDVTSIGNYAFSGCSGLTSVTIPNSVTSIGDYAFYDCSGLEKVIVPNFDIKKWCSIDFGDGANPLQYAHHLYSDENTEITELVIPDDMTSISQYAFYGWNTYVVIPETINPYGAFSRSSNSLMKYAIYKSKTPPVDKYKQFNPIAYMIFVPEESVLEYKTMQEDYMATVYPWVNADVEFYTKVTVDEYEKVMACKDKKTITSVAMYDGMDENLTEAMMKDGMNPNCQYYIFSDKEITGDNIIDLKTCTANRIVLQSNNIFKCPVSFTATKAQFTYTPSVWANGFGGWETLCLPFEVSAFKASESGYISPILLGAYGDFWLRQFVGASSKALYFSSTLDGTMKANTPYLLAFPGTVMGNGHLQGQTITFLGKNVEFEANATAEVQRNDKVFVGNYDNVVDDASGWILNSTGSDLIASSVVGDKPFRAYFRTEDDFADFNAAKTLNISFVEDEETAIREINEDRDAENDLNIYSIDGTLIRKAENTSDSLKGLKKGTYIINHKKVMIR